MIPLIAAFRQIQEEFRVRRLYYSDRAFAKRDKELLAGPNPYRISRIFLANKGVRDVHLYGETPLSTYATIAQEAKITAHDRYVDLGCGRGRGVFFMAHQTGCSAHGVDWIPEFIERAKCLATGLPCVTFSCEDFLTASLEKASVVYIYSTCLSDEEAKRLGHSLEKLPPGSRIISVSEKLPGNFLLKKEFPVRYPWGKTTAYLHEVQTVCPSSRVGSNYYCD